MKLFQHNGSLVSVSHNDIISRILQPLLQVVLGGTSEDDGRGQTREVGVVGGWSNP